ncbi:MAG: hypothetical protein ACD_42C00241G0001 [uncultured bacterium]|nr:MAG: hypothetical protein ACD_42C00241G0001 [uncultured bacterium]OGT34432.1 MAG: hypothetical protein A3C44_00870 [Gammaproteobacteria bacterium RIFCSPHIGHO2_02_FULL_39_13]OGT48488.1 MAG: hypothetical protein A3E53_03800 [Gammaproteobacteria bacterium RIFCSPHIGHO2_12_FULL_39_24]
MKNLFPHINPHLLLSIIIAASAGLLFGFDTGNIAGALVFIGHTFHTSITQNEWIVSLTILGAFLAAILSGKAVDYYGRKTLLMLAALFYITGALLGAFSVSIMQLMEARFILGLAIGISSYTAPLYISEISPVSFRGFFVLLNGVAITGGEAIAYASDYHFSFTHNWREMLFIGIFPAIILGVGTYFMPDSPRWLIMKGKIAHAKKILSQFYNHIIAEQELQKMLRITPGAKTYTALIRNPAYRKLLAIGITLGIFQQLFGINTVMYYGPFIFQQAGFHDTSSGILLTFYMGLVNTAMTIITGLTIDRFGRRALLITGSLIAAVSLFILSSLFHVGIHHAWQGTAILLSMMAYIVGYCISVGSLFWLIISEIFPLSVRGQAMSIATAIQWLANFLVSVTFLSLLHTIGTSMTFSLYALVCCAAVIFTYFYIPETRRLSLEEIESANSEARPGRASANEAYIHFKNIKS